MRKRSPNNGLSRTREYRAWAGMIQRCTNERLPKFPRYGGRGIRVCERWRFSFTDFLADMGPRPSPKHSLDRIDVNGHYEPGNCRWATAQEQQWNRENNHNVTIAGTTLPVTEWSRRLNVNHGTLIRELRSGATRSSNVNSEST
jgi:hypothetical protein